MEQKVIKMYHISKDKRAKVSAEKIGNGFVQCLQTKSFTDITVTEVQKKSGVGRATFYRLFDNTSDVLSFLCDRIFVEAGKEFSKMKNPTTDQTTLCFIERCMENKLLLKAIIESNRMDLLYNAHVKFIGQAQTYFFPETNKEELNYLLITLTACISAFVIAWQKNGSKETAENLQNRLKVCLKTLNKIFH